MSSARRSARVPQSFGLSESRTVSFAECVPFLVCVEEVVIRSGAARRSLLHGGMKLSAFRSNVSENASGAVGGWTSLDSPGLTLGRSNTLLCAVMNPVANPSASKATAKMKRPISFTSLAKGADHLSKELPPHSYRANLCQLSGPSGEKVGTHTFEDPQPFGFLAHLSATGFV